MGRFTTSYEDVIKARMSVWALNLVADVVEECVDIEVDVSRDVLTEAIDIVRAIAGEMAE